MTEPTYYYIKGQGWVPTLENCVSKIIGFKRVTLIERLPRFGERGLTIGSDTIDKAINWVSLNQGWDCTGRNYEVVTQNPSRGWVTMVVEDA